MDLPINYVFDLTNKRRENYFPNLKLEENFSFTSLKTDEYNCVAWSLHINDQWIEYDLNIQEYITHFVTLGFRLSENENLVGGLQKIAIFGDNKNQFTHIARQLNTGKWTSKLGEWEDIEHDDLEAVSGNFYGNPFVIMER